MALSWQQGDSSAHHFAPSKQPFLSQHFSPFSQLLGLQHLTWNKTTQKHQKHKKYSCSSASPCTCCPHNHNHYHITVLPWPLPTLWRPAFVYLLDQHILILLLLVTVVTTNIGWVKLCIPSSPNRFSASLSTPIAQNIHNKINHSIGSEATCCHLGMEFPVFFT